MRRQIINTTRNTVNNQSQFEIIPRNDRLLSPRNDKSLERRSKSIKPSELSQFRISNQEGSQTNQLMQKSLHSFTIQTEEQGLQRTTESLVQFKISYQRLKKQNSELIQQNQSLLKQNQIIKKSLDYEMIASKKSDQSDNQGKANRSRIKAIQQKLQYYQAQSKANEVYSNCIIEISKCLSLDQLSLQDLKNRIQQLVNECQAYKDEIKRLDEICLTKEYNANEQLQKIIVDFNETIFKKNQLEIKIFDLTSENNSLKGKMSDFQYKFEQQQIEIQKLNEQITNFNTNLSTSKYMPKTESSFEKVKCNLQHFERQNQHLKMEIDTLKTKVQHYHGSQLNYKQQITRLNNFMAELNTKWTVQFEHNGVLQQQRNNHMNQIKRLASQIQRLNLSLNQSRNSQTSLKLNLDSLNQNKRVLEKQVQMLTEQIKNLKQNNFNNTKFNQTLQSQVKGFHLKINSLNETIVMITKNSQDKQNNYLNQLNSLRQQNHELTNQWQKANQNLIQKQEQIRIIRQQIGNDNQAILLQFKNQARLQIERQRQCIDELNKKIIELENRIQQMHKQYLQQQSQLSSKRILISELEQNHNLRISELEQIIQRNDNTFRMQKQSLIHTKTLIENQLLNYQHHNKQLDTILSQVKQSQSTEIQVLQQKNHSLLIKNQQNQLLIQKLAVRVSGLQVVEIEKNKYQSDCLRLQKDLNQQRNQMQQFIKKIDNEQILRRNSYEQQITSLQQIIQRSEDQKRVLRQQFTIQINQMKAKHSQLQTSFMKQSLIANQDVKAEAYLRTAIHEIKQQYGNQLQGLKIDLLDNLRANYQKNFSYQMQSLIHKNQQKLNNVASKLQKILTNDQKGRNQKKQIQQLLSNEIKNIKNTFSEEMNKNKNKVDELLINQKLHERSNNQKIIELQNKILSYEDLINKISTEKSIQQRKEIEFNQRNNIELDFMNKQIQTLKQTNTSLNKLLIAKQDTIKALKNQLRNQIQKYMIFKADSTSLQNTLNHQIKILKINLAELEKYNLELATKATFTDNDRTLDRLASMPDLNTSLNQIGNNINNPERDDNQRKTISNKLIDRTFSSGTQVIVNVIQKDNEIQVYQRPQSPIITSPTINRDMSPVNQRSFGVIPMSLNQQPTSPTHRICFAAKRRSNSPPIKIAQNIEIIKSNDKFNSRFNKSNIQQIPSFPINKVTLNNFPLKPSSPPINQTILPNKLSSEPIIHFPSSNFGSKSNQKIGSTTLIHSNSTIINRKNQNIEQTGTISEIRYN